MIFSRPDVPFYLDCGIPNNVMCTQCNYDYFAAFPVTEAFMDSLSWKDNALLREPVDSTTVYSVIVSFSMAKTTERITYTSTLDIISAGQYIGWHAQDKRIPFSHLHPHHARLVVLYYHDAFPLEHDGTPRPRFNPI